MRMMKTLLTGLSGAALLLSGCATVSDAVDRINPFDQSDAQKRAAQGAVAGQEDRISLLSLKDELTINGDVTPDQVVLPPPYVNPNWPQTGGNIAHAMGHTAASGPLGKVWSKSAGKGSGRKGRITASPIVVGGTIFAMDADNRVSAFNGASGARIWQHKITVESKGKTREGRDGLIERATNPTSFFRDGSGSDKESVGGGLAFSDGKVYVSSGLGVVEALDPSTGGVVWRKRLSSPMHSAPTVSGGRLFVVSDDNELMALDANAGDVLWTYQGIIESARMLTTPSPAVVDDVVIAPFASGEIVALSVQNGTVLWQDALSSTTRLTPLASLNDIPGGPVVADGYVFAGAQSGVMAGFDLRTGQRLWTQPAGTLGYPLVAGDFLYTVTTDGEVVCMAKATGNPIWIKQLPSFKNEKKRKDRIAWSGPVLAGNRLLAVSSQGRGVTLNPQTGDVTSEFKVGDAVYVPPIIAGETVYLYSDDAKIIALR